jgi:UDP-N-acetylmuramoyl-L-alanyl-D-glutamate--2,6-diaminopimelate ligase
MNMKLSELLEGMIPGEFSLDPNIIGLVCDSRQVKTGTVFVALSGTREDGAAYIADAIGRGAAAVITERPCEDSHDVPVLYVDDAGSTLARLAARFHGHPADRLQMIGVTGTNGKTTVATLVRDMLRDASLDPGLISTVSYQIGSRVIPPTRTTPEAPVLHRLLADMLEEGCECAVMEVSSHALLQRRTSGIDFDVGVFTNLSHEHLDYHKDIESYFEAKCLLFETLGAGRKQATAIVNLDDAWGRRLYERKPGRANWITFGTGSDADVRAESIELSAGGSVFEVHSPWGHATVDMKLLGRFNISNALAAMSVGGSMGIPVGRIGRLLGSVRCIPGRLEDIPTASGFKVFVDYAHSDDALDHVLRTVREFTRNRLILVFGCGGNRDITKRAAMGRVASQLADHCIVTSDNPRSEEPSAIIEQVLAGIQDSQSFGVEIDREQAIFQAIEMAREGDVVIIAGKGHETFQEFANRTIPFDDRKVVSAALETRDVRSASR